MSCNAAGKKGGSDLFILFWVFLYHPSIIFSGRDGEIRNKKTIKMQVQVNPRPQKYKTDSFQIKIVSEKLGREGLWRLKRHDGRNQVVTSGESIAHLGCHQQEGCPLVASCFMSAGGAPARMPSTEDLHG